MPTLPSGTQHPNNGNNFAPSETTPSPNASPRRLPRVAVLGLRGVPASWGGVERQCEELYTRLAAAGFPITIYCRSSYVPHGTTSYRGIRLIRLPAVAGKHMEAFLHTLLACLHLIFHRCDIVHLYSQGPALFAPLIRLIKPKCRIFFTCGGLDWQRKKWSPLASSIIRCGEWCSARFTDERIMVSEALCQYYRDRHAVGSRYIPNGVTLPSVSSLGRMADLGIAPGGYVLFVGRLVPEKRIQDLIAAVRHGRHGLMLVIAGGTAGCEDYVSQLHAAAAGNAGIIFAGYRFGEELAALFSNARAYVTASELEGLPLSLLEGMAYGLPCLASDIAPHREVLGDTGTYFPVSDVAQLCERLDAVAATGQEELTAFGAACRNRAAVHFNWETAADRLAQAYTEACANALSAV
jgi:glycosyltransferase involved in cell wall biosynthesis